MSQKIVSLLVLAAIAIAYFVCSLYKRGGFKLDDLFILLMTVIGAVTGVYLFWGALKSPEPFSRDAIWGGLTGICITLYSLERIIVSFKCLFVPEIAPQVRTNSADAELQ
jgi:hypothetical protein